MPADHSFPSFHVTTYRQFPPGVWRQLDLVWFPLTVPIADAHESELVIHEYLVQPCHQSCLHASRPRHDGVVSDLWGYVDSFLCLTSFNMSLKVAVCIDRSQFAYECVSVVLFREWRKADWRYDASAFISRCNFIEQYGPLPWCLSSHTSLYKVNSDRVSLDFHNSDVISRSSSQIYVMLPTSFLPIR